MTQPTITIAGKTITTDQAYAYAEHVLWNPDEYTEHPGIQQAALRLVKKAARAERRGK